MNRQVEKFVLGKAGRREQMTRFLFVNETRAFGKGPEHDLWVKRANGRKTESALTELLKNMEISFVIVEGRPVVIDLHAMQRADERAFLTDTKEFVRRQINQTILDIIAKSKITWTEKGLAPVSDSRITATAVVQQGCDLVPVYESGEYYLNVRSFLAKGDTYRRNYFLVGTKVLYVDREGSIIGEEDILEGTARHPHSRYPKISQEISNIAFS